MPPIAPRRARGRPRKEEQPAIKANQSLDRALVLLKVISQHDGVTLTDLSAVADLPPSTTHRLLTTLADHKLVEMVEAEQKWTIGIEALRIGMAFQRRTKLAILGRADMLELMERTGETVNLGLFDEGDVVFISQVECHEPIRAFFRTGERRAIHASGIGKALLAEMTPAKVDRILQQKGLPVFTPRTITDPQRLAVELQAIRDRGWSLDDEEANPGMRCIAAPIFNEFSEAIAGISLSGPSARLTSDRIALLGPEVRAQADKLTRLIGGMAPVRN